MRFKNSFSSAVAAAVSAVVFSAAFQPAEASFIFYAEQVGANVVITGQGSFNTTTLASSGTVTAGSFGTPAGIAGRAIYVTDLDGNLENVNRYTGALGTSSANISGLGSTQLSSTAAPIGDWLTFSRSASPSTGYSLRLSDTYTSNAALSNSMTIPEVTLSELGWSTAGTNASPALNSSFTLANGETIQFVSVPEPTHMVSVAGIGAAYGAWRLRKLRRNRTAAGEAIAS